MLDNKGNCKVIEKVNANIDLKVCSKSDTRVEVERDAKSEVKHELKSELKRELKYELKREVKSEANLDLKSETNLGQKYEDNQNPNSEEKLNIFHIETMGTLDGPGIRTVVFLKGCPLRCHYCHNPESWQNQDENFMTHDEIFNLILRMKPYYKNGGGVTFSGGEPLVQSKQLVPLCMKLKAEGIHIAIDTSGCLMNSSVKALLEWVDLVLLDVKHTDALAYHELTGGQLENTIAFLQHIKAINKPYWIRQVIVPNFNDGEESVMALDKLTESNHRQRLELLAFHNSGMEKWAMDSPFKKIASLDKQILVKLQQVSKKSV